MGHFRDEAWLQAVRDIGECVICGRHGVQAAHRNEGKGMGMKCADALCAALCPACHHEADNGAHLTKEERREMLDRAILRTIELLFIKGIIGVLK